jgi:hypothetical protein
MSENGNGSATLALDMAFDNASRTFSPGDVISGRLEISCTSNNLKHEGIAVALEATVTMTFDDIKGASWAGTVTRTLPMIETKK